jgi:hypothetical protein
MIKLYLSELFRIHPFSTETLSGGRALEFQRAVVASSVRMFTGFESALIGILFYPKNGMKLSTKI